MNKLIFLNRSVYIFFLILVLASCRSMGPQKIPLDSFNYNDKIAQHQQEQMLLNIVRLRYGEVPLFMNVNSMINSYTRQGNVGVGTSIAPGGSSQRGDISGSWSDKPTITYTPMAGAAFSQSLLTPLPPASVFFLVQSGWSVDLALRVTTNAINRHSNNISTLRKQHESSPEYDSLLVAFQRVQDANSLGLKLDKRDDGQYIDLYFPDTLNNDNVRDDVATIKRLSQLRSDLNSFTIVYGIIQDSNEEIVVQTRSMLEILVDLAYHIEVPEEHISLGLTGPTFIPKNHPGFHVKSSKNKPDHALVAINTRDYWFYVDDRDIKSKTIFSFIQIVMSLTENGQSVVSPLISIGN